MVSLFFFLMQKEAVDLPLDFYFKVMGKGRETKEKLWAKGGRQKKREGHLENSSWTQSTA